MEGNMTYEDQKKELYFANAVIGVIDNVKTPMLMYQEEKDVVRDNGYPVVVVDLKNYENVGSCSYDRKYLLCDLEYLENSAFFILNQQNTRLNSDRGTNQPLLLPFSSNSSGKISHNLLPFESDFVPLFTKHFCPL